jgi:hypothetical protein
MPMDLEGISYHGPMSEDDYLDVVLRIQQAMAIEPFQPSVVDVVKLLADWRDHNAEIERLRAALQAVLDDQEGDLDFVKWKVRQALARDKQG